MTRNIVELEQKAKQLRRDVIEMVFSAQSGHIGGSLSMMDVLVALFYGEMDYDSQNPNRSDRDRFVLSKGHTSPGLYSVLADVGYFPREELMTSFRCIGGMLQGHPAMNKTPGVEMTSGSLGIGLSAANGMALGNRHQNIGSRIYCMLGDGEINEGQIWEAAATAAQYKLDTVTAFIDMNGLQNDASTKQVKDMLDVRAKWEAFGWKTFDINGHDFTEIFKAIDEAKQTKGQPSAILCRTVKGKGVSFMENVVEFHGKTPSKEEYLLALEELS
ncbi:transketolase [Anaerocolumna xylanovorans]|uniref:Transketolase subunit A n=1 Tax=Anaerocolumna xylanovorans DSM 12503 TaxID=1121345 RepID=A0A1M7YN54_9FIRM|nr:transketolase [Anaerocolumna xylanovorans]SHO54054.1 transketolase subunit A [Anaerocolumna xylanovorans DSM 12503]